MATKAQGNDAYEKAALDEEVFTLRAQDLTADTVIEFWGYLNAIVQHHLSEGIDPDVALVQVRALLQTMLYDRHPMKFNQKIVDAQVCAATMRAWKPRKWAD